MRKYLLVLVLVLLLPCSVFANNITNIVKGTTLAAGTNVSNQASSGGGGSGFTLIAHAGASGVTGDTTTPAIDTTSAVLIIVDIVGGGTTHPTVIDSKANSGWTVRVDWTNNAFSIFDNINPASVGAGHTFTAQTVSGCNIQVYAYSKAGGSPVFDQRSTSGTSGNWSSSTISAGSITPSGANNVYNSVCKFDVGLGVGDTCNSGFFVRDSPQRNVGTGIGMNTADLIVTGDSTAKSPGWARGTPNNSDCWVINATWQ